MKNTINYYDDLWGQRHDIQPTIIDKTWSKGRMKHLAFLYRVTDVEIIQNVQNIQNDLSQYSCYDPFPLEYMHITVKVLGFLNNAKEYEDDISDNELDDIMKRAEAAFSCFEKFDITIGGMNLVPQVAFAQVLDNDITEQLNKAVLDIPGVKKREGRDFPDLMPHMTMGQFKSTEDFNELIKAIEMNYRDHEFGTASIDKIELVLVHLEDEYPLLETIKSYGLK